MKFIVVFALLAFFASADPTVEAINGFTTGLGWTEESTQTQNLNNCLMSVAGGLQTIVPIIYELRSNPLQFVIDAAVASPLVESSVKEACAPVINDLVVYAVTYGNGQSPKVNLAIYSAYVSQEFAGLILNGAQGSAEAIGTSLANLFILSIGADAREPVVPTVLSQDQQITLQQQVMTLFTNATAARELIQAELAPFDLTDAEIEAVVSLVDNYKQLIQDVVVLTQQLQGANFEDSITAVQTFVSAVASFLRNNEQGVKVVAQVNAPFIRAFIASPVEFIAQATFNTLFNMPEYIQGSNSYLAALLAGDFSQAGTIVIQMTQLIFGFAM